MVKRQFRNLACLVLMQLVITTTAYNDVQGQTVTTNQIKETSVTYNRKKEKVICLGKVTGSIVTRSGKINFTSFSASLSKTPRSSTSKYNRLKALVSLGTIQCKKILNVRPGSTPTPRPSATPSSTATPKPTPTPTPATGNFDAAGNVTAAGKILFGIPSNLSANISQGRTVQQTKCTGCHAERTGRTFPDIRTNIARSPMLFDEAQIPDPMLANLIAYLNRFRPN